VLNREDLWVTVAEPVEVAEAAPSDRRQEHHLMSRDLVIILGAMAWSLVALDVGVHLIFGDVVVPLLMVATFVTWYAVRRRPARRAVRV
jgi:hypothetical protein